MIFRALVIAIVFVIVSCNRGEDSAKNTAGPNILLIMTDDVTFDHWSSYADDFPTPHIETLAKEGMLFYQAYTTSAACTPSRYSIMTGQYPGRCMAEEFLSNNPIDEPYVIAWNTPITEENLTLHKVMKKAGYYTGYVGKFHIGELGYERSQTNPAIPYIDPALDPNTELADSLLEIHQRVVAERVRSLSGADFAGAIQWANPETLPLEAIRKHNLEYQVWAVRNFFASMDRKHPFFLTVNSTALHGPNHFDNLRSSPVYTAEGRIDALQHMMPSRSSIFQRLHDLGLDYGEGVDDHVNHYLSGRIYMDDQLGAIMQMLYEYGLDKNTLVIYTTDHNIEPGKSTIYNRGVNVPFVAWWPEHIQKGSQSYDHIQFVDFLPTFAELGGIDLNEGERVDGESFAKALEGPKMYDNRLLYFEEGYTRGVTNGKYKYIAMRFPSKVLDNLREGRTEQISHMGNKRASHASVAMEYYPAFFDADQLYDLEEDPYEQENLAYDPDYARVLMDMRAQLQQILQTFDHPFDLDDNAFNGESYYRSAAEAAMSMGTDWIPWWNRTLDFPPDRK